MFTRDNRHISFFLSNPPFFSLWTHLHEMQPLSPRRIFEITSFAPFSIGINDRQWVHIHANNATEAIKKISFCFFQAHGQHVSDGLPAGHLLRLHGIHRWESKQGKLYIYTSEQLEEKPRLRVRTRVAREEWLCGSGKPTHREWTNAYATRFKLNKKSLYILRIRNNVTNASERVCDLSV